MKNKIFTYGLALNLSLAGLGYSQEKFKDYVDGDKVMMIHQDIADTTKVGLKSLKDFMVERGGTNSIVGVPKTITKIDTVYQDKILPLQNSNSRLESKTRWYNSNWFKFFVIPSVGLTAGYFIADQSRNNDKKHSDDNSEQPSGTIIDYSESGGIRGSIEDLSESGGNRK